MPDVVQGVRRVGPRFSLLEQLCRRAQAVWVCWLGFVFSLESPKAPELGCAPCPELREWEERAAPALPFHPTGYTPKG